MARETTAIGESRLDDFMRVASLMNAHDPRWVPPLEAPLRQELTSRDAFGRYGRLQLFLCEDGGRLLGRAAALVNPRLEDESGAVMGQIGYFECVDDAAVAGELFEHATAWLRQQGARQVVGPMNGGAHRPHRFMVRGFEHDPFLFEPRNPQYYPKLFETHGFRRVHTWHSSDVPRARFVELRSLFIRVAERVRRLGQFGLQPIDESDPGRTLATLHTLLDGFWGGHVGYASIDRDEFVELFAGVLVVITPRWMNFLTDVTGKPCGVAFGYIDYVNEVRALRGDASGWGRWTGPVPKRRVFHTIAAVPEARRKGGVIHMIDRAIQHAIEDDVESILIALTSESFDVFEKVIAPNREYALYGRAL